MNVSCPPHQIGAMGETLQKDAELSDENETPEETSVESETNVENETPEETSVESETNVENDSEDQELENPDVVKPTV